MNITIRIRELRAEDYKALIALWEQAGLPYKPRGRDSQDEIERQLQKPTAIYLVAETDGLLIGSVLGTHDGRKGWINRLAVHPDYRQQGIARRLVEEVERRLNEMGIEIVCALIEDWNDASMKAFERLGYQRHSNILYFSKRKSSDV